MNRLSRITYDQLVDDGRKKQPDKGRHIPNSSPALFKSMLSKKSIIHLQVFIY